MDAATSEEQASEITAEGPAADELEGIIHGKLVETHGGKVDAMRGAGKPSSETSDGYIVRDRCNARVARLGPAEAKAELEGLDIAATFAGAELNEEPTGTPRS